MDKTRDFEDRKLYFIDSYGLCLLYSRTWVRNQKGPYCQYMFKTISGGWKYLNQFQINSNEMFWKVEDLGEIPPIMEMILYGSRGIPWLDR